MPLRYVLGRAATLAAVLMSTALPARGQDTNCAMTNLFSVRPPIVGYGSNEGLMYDAVPLSYERALFDHGGLHFTPSAIVFSGTVRGYGLLLSAPLYLTPCSGNHPYGGLYAGPLISGWVTRFPTSHSTLSLGAEAGYRWTFAKRWQFTLGLWLAPQDLSGSSSVKGSSGGFLLGIGRWL